MIPRLWRPYVRVRQWWRDRSSRSLAETRDRTVNLARECESLRRQIGTLLDERQSLRDELAAQTAELTRLRGHSALLLALLEIDALPEVEA